MSWVLTKNRKNKEEVIIPVVTSDGDETGDGGSGGIAAIE